LEQSEAEKAHATFERNFGVFPTRVRGLALGLLLGIIAAIVIQIAAPEFALCGIIAMIVFGIAGWLLGMVIQSQHDW
jgi:hypothetical protein